MAVKIRLQRKGRKKRPFYHIVVADARAPRDGRYIERIGSYDPVTMPATIELDTDKTIDWLQKGAQPSDTVKNILSYKGVLYKKHLLRGVKMGVLKEDEVETKFQQFVEARLEKEKGKYEEAAKKIAEKKAKLEAEKKAAEEEEKRAAKAAEDAAAAEAKAAEAEAQKEAAAVETPPAPVEEAAKEEIQPVSESKADEPEVVEAKAAEEVKDEQQAVEVEAKESDSVEEVAAGEEEDKESKE